VRDVELDVCPLDADQRFEGTCLTPGEPTAQLAGVQRVGVRSTAPGTTRQAAGVIGSGWNGRSVVVVIRQHLVMKSNPATEQRARNDAAAPTPERQPRTAHRVPADRRTIREVCAFLLIAARGAVQLVGVWIGPD
jgi:hypothetical protein